MLAPVEELLRTLTNVVPGVLGLVAALVTVFAALRAGILKRIKFGPLEIQGDIGGVDLERIRSELAHTRAGTPIPFEIEQLANYYSLTLGQARVSFWFSLVFASIGFVVIVSAAVFYSSGDYVSASIKIASGLVIDAVSALFFVQSRRAQESMSAFFEKLRNDRQFVEARKICEEIADDRIKDNLKTVLVLHYSGIDAGPVISLLTRLKD